MSDVSLVDGHIDNGMSDEDIIKALECCSNTDENFCCLDCPLKDVVGECLSIKSEKAIEIINRQKAEIERLKQQPLYDFYKEKSEAINELVKRLKDRVVKKYEYTDIMVFNELDNLVKEMTESK